MARYWVGGSGTWDSTSTTHWSATSGGAGGASVPTSTDDVYFDSNSSSGDYTVSVSSSSIYIKNATFNHPSSGTLNIFIGSFMTFRIYGSLYIADNILTTNSWSSFNFDMYGFGDTFTIYIGDNNSSNFSFTVSNAGSFVLNHNLTCFSLDCYYDNLNVNNYNITLTSSIVEVNGIVTYYNLIIPNAQEVRFKQTTTTITNNLEISSNYVLINSTSFGTQRTINAYNLIIGNNPLFRDINATGSANWNIATAGDIGNNTGITFSTSLELHWANPAGGNWNDVSNWYTSNGTVRVPLVHDTIIFDCVFNSGTQTITMPSSLYVSSFDLTTSTGGNIQISGTSIYCFGSLKLRTGTLFPTPNSINIYMYGSNKTSVINFNGVDLAPSQYSYSGLIIDCIGGNISLESDIMINHIDMRNGDFITNGYNLFLGYFYLNSTTIDSTRNVNISNSTININLSSNSSNTWRFSPSTSYPANLVSDNSIIKFTGIKDGNITIYSSNTSYNKVLFDMKTSINNIIINGTNNTFNELKDIGTKPHQITFTGGSTTNVGNFIIQNPSPKIVKLRSSNTTNAILNKTGGETIQLYWMDVDYITGTPDNTWYMGSIASGSIDGGHNSQIYFTGKNPPPDWADFMQFLLPDIFSDATVPSGTMGKITLDSFSNITSTSASVTVTVTSIGSDTSCSNIGVIYAVAPGLPNLSSDKLETSGTTYGLGTTTLNGFLTGLTPSTTYNVRAIAKNSSGYAMSGVQTFTTNS